MVNFGKCLRPNYTIFYQAGGGGAGHFHSSKNSSKILTPPLIRPAQNKTPCKISPPQNFVKMLQNGWFFGIFDFCPFFLCQNRNFSTRFLLIAKSIFLAISILQHSHIFPSCDFCTVCLSYALWVAAFSSLIQLKTQKYGIYIILPCGGAFLRPHPAEPCDVVAVHMAALPRRQHREPLEVMRITDDMMTGFPALPDILTRLGGRSVLDPQKRKIGPYIFIYFIFVFYIIYIIYYMFICICLYFILYVIIIILSFSMNSPLLGLVMLSWTITSVKSQLMCFYQCSQGIVPFNQTSQCPLLLVLLFFPLSYWVGSTS